MNYRHTARRDCQRAQELLSSRDDDDVLLAALKLRMSLESITYDRAAIYSEELGPEEMKTWQPKKLMERMLEVDPTADADSTIAFGEEPSPGEAPVSMTLMGTDHVLNLRTLKKHYDALGSYLHTPTLAQLEQGKLHDFEKLRRRCDQIIEALETVLGSRVWNSTFANRGEIECACGARILRHLPVGQDSRVVQCWACPASYNMSDIGGGKVNFEPRQVKVTCPGSDCGSESWLWERDVQRGNSWKCDSCGGRLIITLGISIEPAAPPEVS